MLYSNGLKRLKIWFKREGRPEFFLGFCRTEKGEGVPSFYYMGMKIVSLFIIMSMMCSIAQAALNLTVTPYEGGNSLRFGSVDNTSLINKEVRLRITSTGGAQYRLRQNLLEPMANERGEILRGDALSFYTVRGSNTTGSLYLDTPRRLSSRDDIIYTSNRSGDSDSFIIIYSFNGHKLSQSGHFAGRIMYTLDSMGGEPPQTFILNISLDAHSNFDVKIESVSGGSRLKIDTESEATSKTSLKVMMSSKCAGKVSIYQELDYPMSNNQGKILKNGILKFFVSDVSSGKEYYRNPTVLEQKRTLIYSSQDKCENFYVNFVIDRNLLSNVAAGIYRGKLIYTIQLGEVNKVIPVDVEVDIRKIFDIKVISKKGLSFFNVKPNTPPEERIVTMFAQ